MRSATCWLLYAVTTVTSVKLDRIGAAIFCLGGIAGGGPRAVTEFCDWTRGGNCGKFGGESVIDVRLFCVV